MGTAPAWRTVVVGLLTAAACSSSDPATERPQARPSARSGTEPSGSPDPSDGPVSPGGGGGAATTASGAAAAGEAETAPADEEDTSGPGTTGTAAVKRAAPVEVRTSCRVPPPPDPSTLRHVRGVTYAHTSAGPLRFDLARPHRGESLPLVVLIHGGGWRAGKRAHMHREMRMLASLGYAAASLDYRLATARRPAFPGAVGDVRCAIRTLRARADRYGIDPERIAAVGTSAGGHLAALVATAPDEERFDRDCPVEGSARVHAAALYFAPFDLRPTIRFKKGAEPVVAHFLGARPAEDPSRAALASPITHVDASDPPMLLVHGSEDPTVGVEQSRRMFRALQDAGVAAQYVELASEGHGFPLLGGRPALRPATCTTLAFLDKVL